MRREDDRIEGRWVRGKDHATRWLRVDLSDSAGYIWEGNLSHNAGASRAWLIGGAWSFSGDCRTDHILRFNSDGQFQASSVEGTYTIVGNVIRLRSTLGYDEGPLEAPSVERVEVMRVGEDQAQFDYGDGVVIQAIRCR